jgi:hypothetical protein
VDPKREMTRDVVLEITKSEQDLASASSLARN